VILPIGGFSIQLTPKTIAIAIGVLVLVSFGVHYKMVLSQRDSAREKVAVLEKELRLERATYEASKQQWASVLDDISARFAAAEQKREEVASSMSALASRLAERERELNRTNRELAEARAQAVTSSDCPEAVGQFLDTLGWAEGDTDEVD